MAQYILRTRYLGKIRPFVGKDVIKILTGIRRAGKSTLLRMIRSELLTDVPDSQIFELNLESSKGLEIQTAKDLLAAVRLAGLDFSRKIYLFFDEIQLVSDWQKAINALRVDFDSDIYLTGSNASLLSGELATLIAGRYVQFEVFPFQYGEYLEAIPEAERADGVKPFLEFLTLGGMPFLRNLHGLPQESRQYLRDILDSILIKDILSRHKVRNIDLLRRLLFYIFEQSGQTFSARSIQRYLKSQQLQISVETIQDYLSYFVEAFAIHKVPRYNLRGKHLFQSQEKYYLTDVGFREALGFGNQAHISVVLENLVLNELLSRGYEVCVGDLEGKEIDFLATRNDEKLYIQVAYLLADDKTIRREFAPLLDIRDNYPKFVLSLDPIDHSREGVRHLYLPAFLLKEDLH